MDILMPQLGETVTEGTITNWYKRVGEAVKADEPLFDIETDKVSTEIPSPIAGVLAEVLVPAGRTVKVGTRLAVVVGATEQAAALAGAAASAPPATPHPGAAAPTGSHAPSNDRRMVASDPLASDATQRPIARIGDRKLSPVVRRLLAEHGLDAESIEGTGREGRVTRDDVLRHAKGRREDAALAREPEAAAPGAQPQSPAAVAPAPALRAEAVPAPASFPQAPPSSPVPETPAPVARAGDETVVALNNIRRRSAAAMATAWQTVPHVVQAVEVDYARIEAARRAKGALWQAREGYELTYLPFLAWAACQALARYSELNARIDGDRLIVSRRVHLGIAVDLNHEGLVVPSIRDAQDRTLPALAREIRRIAAGARSNRLKPDDYAQPTYTISNSGVFGTLFTAPIVNPPQVAILSTDGIRKRPVVIESPEGDSIAIRPVGILAQSFDHRAVDGAYSAAFLRELKRIVETRAWTEDVA